MKQLPQTLSTLALMVFPGANGWLLAIILAPSAWGAGGATVPWTTYEAEAMRVNTVILGPQFGPHVAASEASGRRCVQLNSTGHFAEFTALSPANSLVLRYSLPDSSNGVGLDSTLSLYINGAFTGKLPLTSRYSWLYGAYPFSNTPSGGSPRNFYDEVRTNGLSIQAGDVVRLQKEATDTAAYYIIDLVDLENVPPPLPQPANSVSVMSYGAGGAGATDDTASLVNCIAAAKSQGKTVWLPAGIYRVTASITIPSGVTIQGAGMWHATLVGDPLLYATPSRRVTLFGNGSNIHLSDFGIVGKLNYRNDTEPNDGVGGSYGTGSTISRVWVEHTKTGAWIVNSEGLVVDGCRFRNNIADGINLCVGMRSSVVTNCTARGTGDDAFAIWPATYIPQTYTPGLNLITHCTALTPFLANGAAIYGGVGNRIEDSSFQDTTYGCGVLISTTFPVGPNQFAGTTLVQRSDLVRCGGYDHGFGWRAALQLCLDKQSISGINLNRLNITDSISDGLAVIAPGSNASTGVGTLSDALLWQVAIPNYGLGVGGRHGLWARADAIGSLTVSNCAIVEYRDDSPDFAFTTLTQAKEIKNIVMNADGSVTLNYATTPGFEYHVEAATQLYPPNWVTLPGSTTNAAGGTVSFTEHDLPHGRERFYRVVAP